MSPLMKPVPERDAAYLAWIRLHQCICCGRAGPSQAAHMETGGKATKGSDYSALPLCHACHAEQHHRGLKTWAVTNQLDVWRECWRYLKAFIRRGIGHEAQ